MCCDLLLLLRHGLWSHTEHTLRGDLPHKGSRPLHCHMRPHVLDRRHHRDLLSPRAAQLHRSSRCFGMYAIVCVVSWVFVYLKVPETKGMPLEVITEFFSVGAKQKAAASKSN